MRQGHRRRDLAHGHLDQHRVELVPEAVAEDRGEALEEVELAALHHAAHVVHDLAVVDRVLEVVALARAARLRVDAHVDLEGLADRPFLRGDAAAPPQLDAFEDDGQASRHGAASLPSGPRPVRAR